MKSLKRTYDINAHIENVVCDIDVKDGLAIAKISFVNLGYGDITAIKFIARGYNSFGDLVLVNGKENFWLIIQDVLVKKNSSLSDVKVNLPNSDIRKVELEESQICFADGKITKKDNKKEIEVDLEQFNDEKLVYAFRRLYGSDMRFKVKELEEGWICSCGRYNSNDEKQCSFCNAEKNVLLYRCSDEGVQNSLIELQKKEDDEKKEAEQKAEKLVAEKKAKAKKTIIASIIGILISIPLIYLCVMGQRTTFESEKQMQDAVKGTYTYYKDGDAFRQMKISGNKMTITWKYSGEMDYTIKEWNPQKGTFYTYEKIVVMNNGNLKVDGEIYEKGGYMSQDSDFSYYDYERGYDVLDIYDLEWDNNSSYNVCVGKVKNTGKETYYFVEVKGTFEDSAGNVLDTDWTYVVGSEGLEPGESASFRLSVDRDYNIDNCTVRILEFD